MSVVDALAMLGLREDSLRSVANAPDPQRDAALEAWKDGALREAHRARALALHPDRTGRDTTAEMARVNAARDVLRDLRVIRRPPPRQVVVYRAWGGGVASGSSNASTTSTVTGGGDRFRIVWAA